MLILQGKVSHHGNYASLKDNHILLKDLEQGVKPVFQKDEDNVVNYSEVSEYNH